MKILNFSHPLTTHQLAAISALSGQTIEPVLDVKTHFDQTRSFVEQVKSLVEAIPLTPEDWQTAQILVNPPALSVIAALVLAELHGRMGYFPAILRLRSIPESLPPQFEVAEILNLQAVRDSARNQR